MVNITLDVSAEALVGPNQYRRSLADRATEGFMRALLDNGFRASPSQSCPSPSARLGHGSRVRRSSAWVQPRHHAHENVELLLRPQIGGPLPHSHHSEFRSVLVLQRVYGEHLTSRPSDPLC